MGGKKSNKIFGCFGVRAERSGDKFGVFFRGVSGVELCDDHHTALPLLFVPPTPVVGPLLCALLPSHLDQSSDE